jgi:hypothetical protein
VYAGYKLVDALAELKIKPDFDVAKQSQDADVEFAHRKLVHGDIYFVDNRSDHGESIDATFRVAGMEPELWYAETGAMKPVSFKVADGRTTVPLELEPWGTVFVVFQKSTSATSRSVAEPAKTELASIAGPWKVAFQEGRGAPDSITMSELSDWSKSDDQGVKYFSGIGTYTNKVNASADWFKSGARLWIELGDVKNLAVVKVNGKEVGETWHAPYRVDATSALKPGVNEITIEVVNAWVNRLIGDQQPGAKQITFTVQKPYRANSPLVASGLLGPVRVVQEAVQ